MPISVACSGCGHAYAVKDELAGKRFKCKQCGQPVAVPGGSSAASAPVAPAPLMPTSPPPQPGSMPGFDPLYGAGYPGMGYGQPPGGMPQAGFPQQPGPMWQMPGGMPQQMPGAGWLAQPATTRKKKSRTGNRFKSGGKRGLQFVFGVLAILMGAMVAVGVVVSLFNFNLQEFGVRQFFRYGFTISVAIACFTVGPKWIMGKSSES